MAQQFDDLERIKIIKNGEKTKQHFSKKEMEGRISKLRNYMGKENIDAAFFTSYQNVCYFSEFLFTSFGRQFGLMITPDKHVTISANIDAGMPWRRSYDDNIVYTDWHKDNFLYAAKKILSDANIKKGRLGIEYDFVTIDMRRQMEDAFPDFELVDISKATMKQRMIKSREEQDFIIAGAKVADVGGYAVREAIAEGVPEYEVALAGQQAMVREIAKVFPHTELRDTWVWFQSGINTDGAHNWAKTRKIQRGDILSLNTFPMINGYYTALERTLFCQEVDAKSMEYWNINIKVLEHGFTLIKPGKRCMDIAAELNEIYREKNLVPYRTFGYGHSFGVLSHYYGREAGLEIREDNPTVLEPGNVVSMEPMIMIPEGQPGAGGYREHNILVIRENGEVENVTGFPYGPEHNIVKR
jgi:creatinase